MIKSLRGIFLSGLAVILPISLTAYILYWIATRSEALLAPLFHRWLPESLHLPGIGVVAAVLLVFVVGVLTRMWLISTILGLGERILKRIPLVKTIFNPLKDMMGFFTKSDKTQLSKPVRVRFGRAWVIGFITKHDVDLAGDGEKLVAVYFPMSYQIGGYTVMLAKDSCHEVNMSVEEAMRFALTAGLATAAD
ncbi:MAG: DUF502 domain-containing protein [Planctomycetota bacterium]|jgi:uncharacterized membrane protein|nr:DUF502 domain-containing protein [Planctomycetota bacterium]